MSIKDQINLDLKEAMKRGEKNRLETIRSLKSAIRYAEIEAGHELDDSGTMRVITKQAKQRRDSIADFQKAGRNDLVEKEAAELAIIETYLPIQLSEAEIRTVVLAAVAELNVTDLKGMSQVMKKVMADLQGQADGKVVSQVVRDVLSER
ncbi:MAG TPA: GatB/YqeY domain-containing protein [Anaerolineae bacterium]|nr:GatB/YqeY domain-containing protein [Anaerolineae bacterium]HMR65629.1 GatB/YqeY domain-containing protein [Anaerolineae bacterium]